MYRSRSSISYDILHGIQFPANLSVILAYLSYFPPPPPVLPGPPPRRSWTCSSHLSSSLSCFVSDDRNPPSLRQYIALNDYNQSRSLKNTSKISINSTLSPSKEFFSLFKYLFDLYNQNKFSFIILSIILLILILIIIISLILYFYFQRHRQRSITTTTNNKNKKFYYNLIPHRQKHSITINNEQKLTRLRKDSSSAQVIRIGEIHTKNNNETEEAV